MSVSKFFLLIIIFSSLSTIIYSQNGLDTILNEEELVWLNENKNNIVYIENTSWPPGEFVEKGTHKGIVSEYVEIFEQKLGIKFQREHYSTWYQAIENFKNGNGDIIGAVQKTNSRDSYMNFTDPFLFMPLLILSRQDFPDLITSKNIGNYHIAGVKGYSSTEYLLEKYPNLNYTQYDNDLAALLATSFGNTDGTVTDLMIATYNIEKYGITNLRIASKIEYTWELRFGVAKNKPELASILNKVLATIDDNQREEIYNRWVHIEDLQETNFFERNKSKVIAFILILAFLFLIVVIIIFFLQKHIKLKTKLLNNELIEKEKLLIQHKNYEKNLEVQLKIIRTNFTSLKNMLNFSNYNAVQISSSAVGILFINTGKNPNFECHDFYSEDEKYKFKENDFKINSDTVKYLNENNFEYVIKNEITEDEKQYFNQINDKIEIKRLLIIKINYEDSLKGLYFLLNKKINYTKFDVNQIILLLNSLLKKIEKNKWEKDLMKAKEKAEESNKLKSEFLHNMSHEIRTPMNAIMGFSDLLISDDIEISDVKYYSKIIKNSSEQLLHIIDDILDVSRLETKKVKIIEKEFNINDLIFQLFNTFEKKANEQKILLYTQKSLSNENSIINTDQSKLMKIMSNLIDNSLKYTKKGQVEFGYYLKMNEIIFFVKDTGIGIEENNREKIFERFSRVDEKETSLIGGLGLGLSIVKENVELLGGKLDFESEKGIGTTFYVHLPIEKLMVKVDNETVFEENKKILIAEDDEINYLYLESLVQLFVQDVEILHATDGQKAVEFVKNDDKIRLIFMDLKMPKLNGFEATKEIKKLKPNIKIVAQTAYTGSSDKDKALMAGCDDFLSKPLKKSDIHFILDEYFL